jgi:hypothetical protein
MFIHPVRASQQRLKIVVSNDQSDRKPNRTPQTIPTADPIPELEHMFFADPKLRDSLRIRAERNEMFRNVRLVLRPLEEPISGRSRVRDRLLRRERLGSDDEERSLVIAVSQRFSHVGSVDVGDEIGG